MIWVIRIIVYGGLFALAFTFLFPLGIIGMLLGAPLAALAILLDVYLTGKLSGRDPKEVAAERILRLDYALSKPGESALGQLEQGDNSPLGPERQIEENPSDNNERPL
jgi:hypothetical protein